MENIAPFGSGNSSDVPIQKYMGATVAKFDCSVDYASQPGSCTISLVQDDVAGDLFVPGVIGSPQYFSILDSTGATIFQYNGILDSISRDTSAGDKSYSVTLVSPLKVLEAVTVILEGYTGYGATTEGLPQFFSEDGYYTISESDQQLGYLPDGVTMTPSVSYFKTAPYSFSNNNANLSFTGMWGRIFNLINVFAAYENEWVDSNGSAIGVVPYAGYGAASAIKGGMRADKVAYALDQIINHTSATSARRYIGGNLVYGTNTYNVCSTAAGYVTPFPYYYVFDILTFVNNLFYYLPEDFVIPGPSITLAEMISTLCDAVNADFIVNLDTAIGYGGGVFASQIVQTYPNTILGGVISITLIPRNQYVNCNQPFSNFTYDLINMERPDQGDFQFAGNINPGSFIPAVGTAANNPLDLDFAFRGTEGSYPYGGAFPVDDGTLSRGTSYTGTRASNISVSLKATPGTVGKMIVGGYQSRMNVVPRDYIYQYWGEIVTISKAIDTCGINSTSQKSIPVITQILPPNDTWDWVAIDMQDLFSNVTLPGLIYEGIYFASVMEIRSAGAGCWDEFITTFKPTKSQLIDSELVTLVSNTPNNQYAGTIAKYVGVLGNNIAANIQSVSGGMKPRELRIQIEYKVKAIHDRYYGREWVAPVPIMRTKITSTQESLIGNFERSWEIADDAYVEPYAFGSIEAPKDASFMNQGRLKAFVNFEHSFPGTAGEIGYDLVTGSLVGFQTGINYKYDFSSYLGNDYWGNGTKDIVFDFNPDTSGSGLCPLVGLAHVTTSISKEYTMIAPNYFSYYNRGLCPFIDSIDGSGAVGISSELVTGAFYCYSYNYPKKQIQSYDNNAIVDVLESVVNDPNNKTFFNVNVINNIVGSLSATANNTNDYVYANSGWVTLNTFQNGQPTAALAASEDHFAWTYSGTALYTVLAGIASASLGYEGNGLPFVRFSTNPVYYPDTYSHDGIDPLTGAFLDSLEEVIISKKFSNLHPAVSNIQSSFSEKFATENGCERACVAPRSVAIPQQSNRYTYGPWVTNYSEVIYGGKFEYEQDPSLVPENYIIPVYGTTDVNWQVMNPNGTVDRVIESMTGTVLSGMAGLNLAGQATANSIDNFSLFAQEEGNVTIPGLPIITRLGQFLLNGPRITDMSIGFSNNQVQTTYNFRSLSPRYGKTNKDLLRRLQKLSNTVKTEQWLNGFFRRK